MVLAVAHHVNLPPRSRVFVPVRTIEASGVDVLLEGSAQLILRRELGVARGARKLQDGRTMVLVTNLRQEPRHLIKGTAVGYMK